MFTIGGSKGGGARDAPPGGPNSFIFMQFLAKNLKHNSTFGSWRTPWGKSWIRHCDPSLLAVPVFGIRGAAETSEAVLAKTVLASFLQKRKTSQDIPVGTISPQVTRSTHSFYIFDSKLVYLKPYLHGTKFSPIFSPKLFTSFALKF